MELVFCYSLSHTFMDEHSPQAWFFVLISKVQISFLLECGELGFDAAVMWKLGFDVAVMWGIRVWFVKVVIFLLAFEKLQFDNAVTWFWFVKIQSFFFLHLRNCYLIILLCGFDRLIQSFSLQCKEFLFEAAVLWLWSWLFWFECDFLDARSSLVIAKLIQFFLQNSFVYERGLLFSMEIEIP